MRYRTTTLLARQNLGVAGTHIIDIPITDVISALRFHLEIQDGAGKHLAHGFDAVSKVEIVDGSDVLMELSMAQMDALHFFERRILGNITCEEIATAALTPDEFYTAVYFGRFPNDPELAFNPKKFVNPQLRITFNAATYNANSTALFMSIFADVFDEYVPSPIGFLQHREFYRYTPVSGAFQYINLPTDLVLRKLIVQPKRYTSPPQSGLAAVRLDEDNMKRIPFDMLYEDWRAMNRQEYGPAEQGIAFWRESGAFPLYHALTDLPIALWEQMVALPTLSLIGVNGCQLTTTDGAAENTAAIGRISGLMPYFCLCYPFGDQKNLEDWYETEDIGTLRLRLLAAEPPWFAAGFSTRVILQQLRRY